MDSLIDVLDRLGAAHEGYATSITQEERTLFEMATEDGRAQILGRFAAASKALIFARTMVAEELKVREAMYTVGGDYLTLSEEDGGACGEALACLEQVDAAIAGGSV